MPSFQIATYSVAGAVGSRRASVMWPMRLRVHAPAPEPPVVLFHSPFSLAT